MTFTVMYRNHALQSGGWRGTFETVEAADIYAKAQAAQSRAFMEYVVCEGTPKDPGPEVKGPHTFKGEK